MKKLIYIFLAFLLFSCSEKEDGLILENAFFGGDLNYVAPSTDPITGLVASYPFNGNANDESGNGSDGLVTNATLTTDRHGNANGAYKFHGYNSPSFIRVPNSSALQFEQAMSISLFLKPESFEGMNTLGNYVSDRGVQCLFAKDHDRRGFFSLFAGTSSSLSTWMGNNQYSSPKFSIGSGEVSGNYLNKWIHIVYVIDKNEAKVYFNGDLKNTKTVEVDFRIANSKDLYFGRYSQVWYPFNGVLDDIKIFKKALTASEVLTLYRE